MTTELLLATDLDGTLLRTDGSVSDRTRTAIAEFAQLGWTEIVFVTGRPPMFLEGFAELTGHRGTVIAANGALVLGLADLMPDIIHTIPADTVREVIRRVARATDGAEFRTMLAHPTLGFERIISFADDRTGEAHAAEVAHWQAAGWLVPKMVALAAHTSHGSDSYLELLAADVGPLVEITHSSRTVPIVEMGPPGVDKGTTLAEYARTLGLAREQVVAVGDMPNDLPMLRWAGHGFAVGNAHDSVTSAIVNLLPGNDDDGVAQLIVSLIAAGAGAFHGTRGPE